MEFNQVRIFIAVAKMKSFSKAAESLFISQPTVTSNVKRLENELGVILFHRNRKNISLTEEGNVFYSYAVELINVYSKAEYSLSGYKKSIEGNLEIHASTIPEQYLLPHIIKEFKEKHPLVSITIRHQASGEVLEDVLSGLINFGFVGAKNYSDSLEYIDFYDDRLVLIIPPEMELVKGRVNITNFAEENIILREEGSGTRLLFERALKKNKLNLTMFGPQIISENLESIKKMVMLGVGISMVPYISVRDEIKSGKLKMHEFDDLDLKRYFSLVYNKNRYLSPIEEKLIDFITKWKWKEDI